MVHTSLKDINLKMNFIVWLEFELAYFEATVQLFNDYAPGIPKILLYVCVCIYIYIYIYVYV